MSQIARRSSSVTSSISPYIVGEGSGDYSTIQSAIDAASTAGASASNPLNVYVKPKGSAYVEDLTLADGVFIIGFTQQAQIISENSSSNSVNPSVQITGNHTSPGSSGVCGFYGINLVSSTGALFDFAAGTSPIIQCVGCVLDAGTDSILEVAIGVNGNLKCDSCQLKNGAMFLDADIGDGTSTLDIKLNQCDVNFVTASTATKGTINFVINETYFNSQISGSSNSVIQFYPTNSRVQTSFSTAFSGGVEALNTVFSSTFNITTMAGTYEFTNCSFSAGNIFTGDDPTLIGCNNVSKHRKFTSPAGDYTTLVTDDIVRADTSAARAINLYATPYTGQQIVIKDDDDNAATNNITISGNGNNIEGAATYVISSDGGAVKLVYDASEWRIIP